MVGRGVFFDMARMLGDGNLSGWLCDHQNELLDRAEEFFGIQVRQGDFLIVRTGHMEEKLAAGSWDGYAGGDAPGLAFETLDWLHRKKVAAIATDTWGVEVRPNEIEEAVSPFHWIAIPIIGLTLGEIFYLPELAADCAEDGCYCNSCSWRRLCRLPGAVGSPTNPLAIGK